MSREFRYQRRVTFAETDMAGVMHFSNYYRWLEEIEHAWWRSLGMSVCTHDGLQSVSWPRVKTTCEYIRPARFEDVLDLSLRVTRVGGKSLEYEVDFARAAEPIARGTTVAVCCQIERGGVFRSIEIPADIRAKLTA